MDFDSYFPSSWSLKNSLLQSSLRFFVYSFWTIFLKVRFILGSLQVFLWGTPWYQNLLVGWFISSSNPFVSTSFSSWIFLVFLSPCRNIKSLSAPSVRLAIGDSRQSSFSSSLWNPILSFPSLYLDKNTYRVSPGVQVKSDFYLG